MFSTHSVFCPDLTGTGSRAWERQGKGILPPPIAGIAGYGVYIRDGGMEFFRNSTVFPSSPMVEWGNEDITWIRQWTQWNHSRFLRFSDGICSQPRRFGPKTLTETRTHGPSVTDFTLCAFLARLQWLGYTWTMLELLLSSRIPFACRYSAKKMWSMFRTLQRQKTKRRRRTNLEKKRSWFSLHVIV